MTIADIATWNVAHQCGNRKVRLGAAEAIVELSVDLAVITEYYPRSQHDAFCQVLRDGGLRHIEVSGVTDGNSNLVFVASRWPLERLDHVQPPTLDAHAATCALAVFVPKLTCQYLVCGCLSM